MVATRRGVIVALMAAMGALFKVGKSEPGATSIWLIVEIPEKTPEGMWVGRSEPCPDNPEFVCVASTTPEGKLWDYALVVRYKGREVRLTGDEIMDALEGQPPFKVPKNPLRDRGRDP